MSEEIVNHPSHYNWHPRGIECIDVIEVFPYNVANAIKYLWRHGRKDGSDAVTDLLKALFYIHREIDRIGVKSDDRDERR